MGSVWRRNRALAVALGAATVLAWLPVVVFGGGVLAAVIQTVVVAALAVGARRGRDAKVRVVRAGQRWVVNPTVRALHRVGLNPLGVAVLETTGRRSGRPRRTPVGVRRAGTEVWLIAEHGRAANYVRNLMAEPRVRVRLRDGGRLRWFDARAEVVDEDPDARQRWIVGRSPLRALNAMSVQLLGAELAVVRLTLGSERGQQEGERARLVPPRLVAAARPAVAGAQLRAQQ